MKICKDFAENMNRVGSGTTEETRMQIAIRSFDDNLFADKSAQTNADRGRFGIPHGGVANKCYIGLQLFLVCIEERLQRW